MTTGFYKQVKAISGDKLNMDIILDYLSRGQVSKLLEDRLVDMY